MILDTQLLIDTKQTRENIKKMILKTRENSVEFRPHFKTHQSHEIGNWFKEFGVNGITVSSIKMGEYFKNSGWNSITIAFPVNVLEHKRINTLASNIDLRVLVSEESALNTLISSINKPLGVYIELDPHYGRSGVAINDVDNIHRLISIIRDSELLSFQGFYTHAGHSYKCRSKEEIQSLASSILKELEILKTQINAPVCYGDTPSCSVLDDFGVIDQISAGNFVFYDWTQVNIGSCTPEEISVAVTVPVVGKNSRKNELLVHGGAVHFSKDSFTDEKGFTYYGVVAERRELGWGLPLIENKLVSISQEHGILSCSKSFFDETNIGDMITILPIHSCLTADLMGSYKTLSGNEIDHMNKKAFNGN